MPISTDAVPLKPCPFCGGTAHYEFDETYGAPYGHYFACNRCAITSGSFPSKADAIEGWNRRAPASKVQADHIADERAAFEKWCETYAGLGQRDFHRTVSGAYRSCYVDDMWDGWKARAGLNSSTGNQEVGHD